MIFVQKIRQTAAHATHAAWLEAHTGYYGKPHGSTVLGRQWDDRATWCGYDGAPLASYRASGYDGRVILPWLGSLLGLPIQSFHRWLTSGGNYTAAGLCGGMWYIVAVGNRHGINWGAAESDDLIGAPLLYITADPHAGPMDAGLSDTGARPAEPIPRAYPWVRGDDYGRPEMPDPCLHGPVTEGERIEARYRGESVAA